MKHYYIEFQKNSRTCTFTRYSRKYLLQPIPKSNPYEKEDFVNPYQFVETNHPHQRHDREQAQHNQLLQQPGLKIFCNPCRKQITQHVFFQYDSQHLCVKCFCNQPQYPEQYSLVQKLDYPLFQSPWSAYHEILLLSAIQKYICQQNRWGFGNWKQIHQYMESFGTKFNQDDIQTHYNTFYFLDKTYLPVICQSNDQRFSESLIERKKDAANCKSSIQNQVSIASLTTHHREDSNNYTFQEIDDFSHKAMLEPQNSKISLKQNKIMGYNHNRKQFEVEFDQKAQKSLSNLEFRDDDLPEQTAVKFRILEDYNQRLSKRYEVSDFIVEHKLLDTGFQKQLQDNRTQYEKQAAKQLKKFMRFSSFSEHSELIRRVAMDKQLKSIIEGLRSFRRTCNSGRLKQICETIRQKSTDNKLAKSKSRGRPRKIIHVDNCEKSNSITDSEFNKNNQNEQQLFKKMKINMKDLQNIIKESSAKNNGDQFVYKGVQIMIVDKKG